MAKSTKWILSSLLIFFIIVFSSIALLPAILSSDWGKNQIINVLNSRIPGKVHIASTSFSWVGPQVITDITLQDPSGKQVLNLQSLSSNTSILGYLYDGLKGAEAEINGFNLTIEEEQPGHTNLHSALGNDYLPYRLEHASRTPLFINLVNVDVKLALPYGDQWPLATAKGQTQYGNTSGEFEIDSETDHTLTMHLSHFPVALVDHLVAMKKPELSGLVRAFLGEILDLSITHTKNPSGIDFEMNAKSTNFTADFSGYVVNDKVTLDRTGEATFSVTPEMLALVEQIQGSPLPVQLQKPAQATLTIEKLSMPFEYLSQHGHRQDVELNALLNLAQVDIAVKDPIGTISIRQLQTSLQTNQDSKTVSAQMQGEIQQQGQPFQLKANATFHKPMNLFAALDSILNHLQAKVEVKGIPTTLVDQITDLKINGEVQGSLRNKADFNLITEFQPKAESPLTDVFGKNAKIQIDGSLLEMQKLDPLRIDIVSDLLLGKLRGKLFEDRQLLLTSSTELKYELTPQVFEKMGVSPDLLALTSTSSLHLTVQPALHPINLQELAEGRFSSVRLHGKMETDNFAFLSQKRDHISVQHLKLPWEINGHFNRIAVDLDGHVRLVRDAEGTLTGRLELTNWLKDELLALDSASLNAHIFLGKLPVIFFVAMMPEQEALLKFLGTMLNVKVDANISALGQREGTVEVAFQGDQLQGNMGVKVGKTISLKDPSQPIVIRTVVTPERFDAARQILSNLMKNPEDKNHNAIPLTLLAPTDMVATIRKMEIPLEGNKAHIPMELIADFSIDELKMKKPSEPHPMVLDKLSAHFDSQNMAKKMTFRMEGAEKTGETSNPFFCNGVIENLFTDTGEINLKALSLYAEAKSKRLPASLFCQLVCLSEDTKNRLEALFGETIETDIKAQLRRMNGLVQASLKGKNGRLKLDAQLSNGIMKLTSPFEIEVEVTPKLGKSILEEVLPIVSGVVSAQAPVKISIDPKGFSLPIHDFSLDKIQMENATITLGKMIFSDKGDMGDVFDLLKPSSHEQLSVWFTPAYLTMHDGILRLKRMDMLMIGRYPLALWGKVDTNKNRVDMRIGLTGVALSQALDVDLEPDIMMQIPLTGTMQDASIEKAKAAARLSALVAQNQGNAHGLLIGAFLDIAGGTLAEEKPPAPTTNPLPWADLMKSKPSTTSAKSESKPEKKKSNKIGKQIEEVATNVLDNLFH